MIKLLNVKVKKYKCIETEQNFKVEDDVTVLVGMNESGKTSVLEAIAKANYFEDDDIFKYNKTHDYPRKQVKSIKKNTDAPVAVLLSYELSDDLVAQISDDLGLKIDCKYIEYIAKYDNTFTVLGIKPLFSVREFLELKLGGINLENGELEKIYKEFEVVKDKKSFGTTINSFKSFLHENGITMLTSLEKYFSNEGKWENPIIYYIWNSHIKPRIPKFMYYDDYYSLPSRIPLEDIQRNNALEPSNKTAKALLELADIDLDNLLKSDDFEDFKAELEATQENITSELFKYWNTNSNLSIRFDVDTKEVTKPNNQKVTKHILDIRVWNDRNRVSLPLKNRSKGFNWFFSFLVWFKKIQEDDSGSFILLLDEPGLNLHAMAQNDLLRFIYDLTSEYQIIYTTHSPFMIDSEKLDKVRTVVEKSDGTHISDSLQEKDPSTLFPLQAALGYTLAQNLFVSPNNLIVEGIADLTFINIISGVLEAKGRSGLDGKITVVPVGGADKVATFVSLMRGNELNVVCLLDTFSDKSAEARLQHLVKGKIISDKKIMFYDEFIDSDFADVEDLFTKDDYLHLYNNNFGESISISDLEPDEPILDQIKKIRGGKNFNHYGPANYLAKHIQDVNLSSGTLDRFEKLLEKVNNKFVK